MPGRIELACADRAVDQPAQEIGQPLIARVVAALRRHGLLCPLPQVRIYDGWHDARGQRHALLSRAQYHAGGLARRRAARPLPFPGLAFTLIGGVTNDAHDCVGFPLHLPVREARSARCQHALGTQEAPDAVVGSPLKGNEREDAADNLGLPLVEHAHARGLVAPPAVFLRPHVVNLAIEGALILAAEEPLAYLFTLFLVAVALHIANQCCLVGIIEGLRDEMQSHAGALALLG